MKKTIFSIIIILTSNILFAQKDTLIISEEKIIDDSRNGKLNSYFYKDTTDSKQLWKINLVHWASLKPSLCFEKKIYKNFNLELDANIQFSRDFDAEKISYFGYNLSTSLKQYINKKHRKLKGKFTNGFSGNYFATQFSLGETSHTDIEYTEILKTAYIEYGFLYGIQRSIGNIGYLDIAGGLKLSNKNTYHYYYRDISQPYILSPTFKIAIGFAKPSLKRRKVKL